jgi:ABC-2 type transport system permease protein
MLAIFLAAPLAYALLTGFVYRDAKATDLPVLVVDLDETPFSDKIIDALDDNQFLKVAEIKRQKGDFKSELLKKNYHAVITIPENFHADIEQKRHPEIVAEVNAGNMLTGNYVSTGIMNVLGSLNAGFEIGSLQKKGIPTEIAVEQYESFQISLSRFYNPSSNYLMFLWPGMLGTIMQQVFLLTLALSFAMEFERKTFSDLLNVSKSPIYLILVKSLPYWIIGLILWFPMLKIMMPAFEVPLIHGRLAFWTISMLFVLALTFLGIMVSIAIPSQLKSTEILMIIATPSFIISGQTWPLSQMPAWVQHLAACIPLTHYLEAFRRILLYQAGFSDILNQIIALSVIAAASLTVSYTLLKIKIKRTLRNMNS